MVEPADQRMNGIGDGAGFENADRRVECESGHRRDDRVEMVGSYVDGAGVGLSVQGRVLDV
jgi:hypothetical protein